LDSKDGRTAFSRENAGCLTWGLDREARGLVVLLPLLLHQPLQSARHREGHLQIKRLQLDISTTPLPMILVSTGN